MSNPAIEFLRVVRRRRAVALLAFLAVLFAAACGDDGGSGDGGSGSGDETEETVTGDDAETLLGPADPASGDPVRVGLVSDGASQAFDNTDELRAGEATADYFNARKGGIAGRPIELVTCETGASPAGAADCANQMIEEGVVAVTMSQSAVAEALWEQLHAAGVPTMFAQASGSSMEADTESTFMVFNPITTFFGLPIAVSQAEDDAKIAFVVIDVPQAVEIIERNEAFLEAEGIDYEVVRVPIGTADMTSQMQQVVDSGAGVAQVIGYDAFCVAAFQGLRAVAFDGEIAAITQCITDGTREAMPGGLEGINVLSTLALGATDDPTYQTYQAVMGEYGQEVEDVDNLIAMGGYAAVAALGTALEGLSGEATPATVVEAVRAMPESEYPGGGGVTYRCNGEADPKIPPTCTNQWLRTTLDADGNPTTYTVEDSTDLVS
jgi:branched-chain amino acid transport system substrate-binding protein